MEGLIACVVAGIVDCAAVDTEDGMTLDLAATSAAFMMSAAYRMC